jgi:hypothetical protein
VETPQQRAPGCVQIHLERLRSAGVRTQNGAVRLRLLLALVGAALLLPAAAEARKAQHVGRYRIDLTAQIHSGGPLTEPPGSVLDLTGQADYNANVRWTAVVDVWKGVDYRFGIRNNHGRASVEIVNAKASKIVPAQNLSLGGAVTASVNESWSGSYPSIDENGNDVRVPYSCNFDFANAALAKYMRVTYRVYGKSGQPPADGRNAPFWIALRPTENRSGSSYSSERLKSTCTHGADPQGDSTPTVETDIQSAQFARDTPMAKFRLGAIVRHPGHPVRLETKPPAYVTNAVPDQEHVRIGGVTDTVVTATAHRVR